MEKNPEKIFSPQPGDIIILQTPIIYPDGTYGPLVKIFKDNFFFTSGSNTMMTKPPTHTFKRGEKILRLFKLYQNWEFVSCKNHKLYLHYPGFEADHPWLKIKTIPNPENVNSKSLPQLPNVRHFTHLPPSRLFSAMSKAEFLPRPRNIIIHTLPLPENEKSKSGSQMCEKCRRREVAALYWSLDSNSPGSVPSDRDLEYATSGEGCDYCTVPSKSTKPWENRFGLETWTETFQSRQGDYLVRYEIDTQYGGQFKKTRLQAELFGYVAHEKIWKYLGMDVADFGPIVQIHDKVYRPEVKSKNAKHPIGHFLIDHMYECFKQPGDIIISKRQDWSVRWDPYRQVGGFSMFYKDFEYFGDNIGGQILWQPESERSRAHVKKIPIDSWVVRLGFFDEYWEFHLNDRADVFTLQPNGTTMLLHYTTDFPHMTQPPRYRFNFAEKEPLLMCEVEIKPNHWDLVVRGVERVHEDPLKSRDWMPDPHHWMRDPTLWGRNIPPRFDKEVELHTYWQGLAFEDKDLLLRVGFAHMDEHDVRYLANEDFDPEVLEATPYGPLNPPIAYFHTNASLELYLVRVEEEDPPKFLYLGRDQYSFPDEYFPEPSIDRPKDDDPPLAGKSQKNVKGVVTKDGKSGGDTKAGRKMKDANQEGEGGDEKSHSFIISGKAGESKLKNDEAAKEVKLIGGDEVALP